jgi:hypothetical protein
MWWADVKRGRRPDMAGSTVHTTADQTVDGRVDDVFDSGDALAALARVVEQMREQRDEDRALVEELQIALAAPFPPAPSAPSERVYPDWVTWVEEWLTVRVSRRPQRVRWCTRYAEHPEVADRLEALWHAWETAWPQPVNRLGWFRDGLDHQLAVITADDGPLRECSAHEGQHITAATLHELRPRPADHSPE